MNLPNTSATFIYMRNKVRHIVITSITWYQRTLSPDHGVPRGLFPHGYCRFHPTCSEYGKTAITKYGVLRGGGKALWRIIRCNPFNTGGYDPVE